jgi:hypothetical protein
LRVLGGGHSDKGHMTHAMTELRLCHSGKGRKSAHFEPFTAAQHGGQMVRTSSCLHYGQVWHEHVGSRHGRRTEKLLMFCQILSQCWVLLDIDFFCGHTFGMKTAISIPDSVFQAAEKHAKRMCKSRSQLFSEAMVEYLDRHTPDEITRRMNETLESIGDSDNSFVRKASQNLLGRIEW